MLLLSYILTGAFELVLTVQTYKFGYISYVWSFGFLLLLSVLAIPLETSNIGKTVRKEFKNLGVNTSFYDFLSNIFRLTVYFLILSGTISHIIGLVCAYSITFIFMLLFIWKYSKIEKK